MSKALTLLFVARHYPPHITGAARRLSGMTRELRALGHRVIVAAPDLPEGEDGIAVPHVQPVPSSAPAARQSAMQSAKAVARRWALWPDADIRWSRRAAEALAAHAARADWIFTSSPPESAHAAGLMLQRSHDLLWAADFRDLWLERPLRPELSNPLRRALERPWARKVTRRADLVLSVDRYIAQEVNELAGKDRALVLPHASDPPDIEPWPFEPEVFHLVHTGSFSLSDSERRIEQLLRAFETISADVPQLRLQLAGRLTPEEVAQVEQSPASHAIINHGIVDHKTALSMQKGASALVLVGSPQSHVPPGKFVEYRALGKPVVVFGEARWRDQINVEGDPAATLRALIAGGRTCPRPSLPAPPTHANIAAQLSERLFDVMAARR